MRTRSILLAGVAWSVAWFAPSLASNGPIGGENPPADRALYDSETVESAEVVRTITASGAVQAKVNVEVGSQLSGLVERVLADFNDTVVKGQVLAELDQRTIGAQREAAAAALAGARAQVAIVEAKLKRAAADVEQAEGQRAVLAARADEAAIAAESALRAAKRKTTLSGSGVVSAAEAQDADSRGQAALAGVRAAQATLASQQQIVEGGKADCIRVQAELDVARAEVRRLKAQLESADLDLERTRIRSPIDGVIIGRNINDGQTIASTLEARTLFVVAADLSNMEVHARVDESDISQVAPGQPVNFTVDAYPHRQFKATVRQVRKAPALVQNVVTYDVVLTAPNEDFALLPGMTAVSRIETARAVAERSVPLAALRFRPLAGAARAQTPLNPTVWVLRGGALTEVTVRLGAQDETRAIVTGGDLRPGDVVLTGEKRAAGVPPGEG